ncbi:class I SAM-dependent methyltransferase [Nesterenkonia natronophila]|uniref:Class I SAM-dependent methyltransferase n=1 Tax=Nesterenkonia natronophila TaxID=2174932 RepID=A0A3A4F3P5_9MICC|nr:class I SAM-dependent methyltransferase [Nesterenkonia natronophila]RJN32371.1 class I SAM-dependent methyltransferase [Nesterenkonia natronophila]
MENQSAKDFWENRYADSDRVWSGQVNATVSALVGELTPGRALDLGCGEGSDVLWLAKNGWEALGVDISATAVERAKTHAVQGGPVTDNAKFLVAKLPEQLPEGPFDLVSASFLQSPVALDRLAILRAAAEQVAVGGHLLVVSHAAAPPWAQHDHGPSEMPTVEGDLEALRPPGAWNIKVGETRQRPAVGPQGQAATLEDAVIFAQKLHHSS